MSVRVTPSAEARRAMDRGVFVRVHLGEPIERGGVGVASSLAAFAAGYSAAGQPAPRTPPAAPTATTTTTITITTTTTSQSSGESASAGPRPRS